jgi:hypothetical protein
VRAVEVECRRVEGCVCGDGFMGEQVLIKNGRSSMGSILGAIAKDVICDTAEHTSHETNTVCTLKLVIGSIGNGLSLGTGAGW